MTYLDPKSDIAFKKLFGDQRHTDITMSFLNAVLERSGDATIVEVTIVEPNNYPNSFQQKTSAVDVRCTDQLGNTYIVEMQVINKGNFTQRSQYYTALTLSNQLTAGEDYRDIKTVIFIGVVGFDIDPNHHYLNHHLILNTLTYQHVLRHMEFHFLELSKFHKTEAELVTIVDKWAYMFKMASGLQHVPPALHNFQPLDDAFKILERGGWSSAELEAYYKFMEIIHSERDLKRAGKEEGVREKALEVAQKLLPFLDEKTIALTTGISEQEICTLKKSLRGSDAAKNLKAEC
jgi:predicted transposase/invertase (TIGR01784 family)